MGLKRISPDEMARYAWRYATGVLPVGVLMSIAEWESASSPADVKGGFNIYAGPPRKKDGTQLTSARGLWQIVAGSSRQYGLPAPRFQNGIDPATGKDDPSDPRLDPDASTRGAAGVLEGFAQEVRGYSPGIDDTNLAGLVYYGHSEGPGALSSALRTIKSRGQQFTVANAVSARGRLNDGNGLNFVQQRWTFWQAKYPTAPPDPKKLLATAGVIVGSYLVLHHLGLV